MYTDLTKSLKEIFIDEKNIDYIVPFYQRNFAWGEEHIYQLMQDVYTYYNKDKNSNYFIGTLVTIKRENTTTYEVIDGQQRLTALSLILRYMIDDDNMQVKIKYDARDHVTNFLRDYYKNTGAKILPEVPSSFLNAVSTIKKLKLTGLDNTTTVDIDTLKDNKDFMCYLKDNVKLVRVEMPRTTDIETYFEIMNNRGEQLKQHEILKATVIEKIGLKYATKGAEIWDACSQMDIYIQKIFKGSDRETLFGISYDEICSYNQFEEFLGTGDDSTETNSNTINAILDTKDAESIKDDKHEYHVASNAIIDFPNFLMQVFKLYNPEIHLNDNNMLDKDNNNFKVLNAINDPVHFLYHLLYCRIFFDRYIVRTIEEKDKNIWKLQKPQRYENTLNYVNTFDDDKENKHIIKTLSMLQVTFRIKTYKNWLHSILSEYCDKDFVLSKNTPEITLNTTEYIQFLKSNIINPYYEKNFPDFIEKIDTYAEGTKTPHFLFNFIDYLYWLENPDKFNFYFKYHNSIEHHLSQHHSQEKEIAKEYLHYLGNLCLVSKSDNSSMSDHSPFDKADRKWTGQLPPKQKIMYKMTLDSKKWIDEEIKQHQKDIKVLLSKKDSLMSINKTIV